MNAQDEIQLQLDLLKIERDEEKALWERVMQSGSLQNRREQGLCWFPLRIVETGYGLGDYPFVVIERTKSKETPHQFQGGKLAEIFSDSDEDEKISGTIQYVSENTLKLILNADEHPDWLSNSRIGINLLFDERSYREMEKALKTVKNAENNRLAELRDYILGHKKVGFKQIGEFQAIAKLNQAQNEAVRLILKAEDIAVIHGPPGTGKTTTLVQAIKKLAFEEKPVLACAPSNAAVDYLTLKLEEEGLNVVRIGNISRIDEAILKHTLEHKVANDSLFKEIKRIRKQGDELRRMASKYKRHFGKTERDQKKLLLSEAKKIIKHSISLENTIIQGVLENADVILSTLVGVINPYLSGKTFSTVVIDEAAQALEPACWIPILSANKVVLAGDPFQLPPVIKSAEAQKQGFNITLIEKCINRLEAVQFLNVQYRMHQDIMGFSNAQFYENKLMADVSVAEKLLPYAINVPVEFIDTAGCSFDEKQNVNTQSYYNPEEWNVIYKHLQWMLLGISAAEIPVIGLISPYREQLNFIKKQLEQGIEQVLPSVRLDVNTIDSFQGQERDIIYISLARSNEEGAIGFLTDYRRMNVAMTRARKKLVVIGDSATLGQDHFYRQFLEYVEQNGAYRSAWEFMET